MNEERFKGYTRRVEKGKPKIMMVSYLVPSRGPESSVITLGKGGAAGGLLPETSELGNK